MALHNLGELIVHRVPVGLWEISDNQTRGIYPVDELCTLYGIGGVLAEATGKEHVEYARANVLRALWIA